jgi:hypothetical protein
VKGYHILQFLKRLQLLKRLEASLGQISQFEKSILGSNIKKAICLKRFDLQELKVDII